MRNLTVALSLLLLLLPVEPWLQPVKGSFLQAKTPHCGPSHSPCPNAQPCCNNGLCHATNMTVCSASLGCEPAYSSEDACFPLPMCVSRKEKFKRNSLLIPLQNFTGDPEQAHWTSDFHHIAPYAELDENQNRLLLKAKRNAVMTKSGGGYGATVSSTRWNRFGTFTAKIKSGATGPGIVTAFMLSNPSLGEEISIELTGKDPKTVITDFYRRLPSTSNTGTTKDEPTHRRLLRYLLNPTGQANADESQKDGRDSQTSAENLSDAESAQLESREEAHTLKKDTTTTEIVYKIEWTEKMIRWSADGRVLRTLHAKDIEGGLPADPMQLQLTIWDAGHSPETMDWAGGKSDYGLQNEKEFVAVVDYVDIACQDRKAGQKPWPGPEAKKRLEEIAEKAQQAIQSASSAAVSTLPSATSNKTSDSKKKHSQHKRGPDARNRHGQKKSSEAGQGVVEGFFDRVVQSLLKWNFIILFLVAGATYLSENQGLVADHIPPSMHSRTMGLQR